MTRLRLPLRFRTQEYAEAAIEAASLYPVGAKPVRVDNRWYVVVDTPRPDTILRYLRQHVLGHDWIVEDASAETPS
jgi:hypothetical protein